MGREERAEEQAKLRAAGITEDDLAESKFVDLTDNAGVAEAGRSLAWTIGGVVIGVVVLLVVAFAIAAC
jgi:hypothetical protein